MIKILKKITNTTIFLAIHIADSPSISWSIATYNAANDITNNTALVDDFII